VVEDAAIPAREVTAQLDRILASKGFSNAGRLSRMLRHVVEKTLAGDPLKEYSVGVDVFDRDEKYDPRLDSIVRVEAGRLRSRLDEYYSGDGASDGVRILLPRGGYTAQFERQGVLAAPRVATGESARRSWWLPAAAAVTVVALGATWFLSRPSDPDVPTIAVLAFAEYAATGEGDAVGAQLTDGVTSELARLGTLGVVSHTSAMQFSGHRTPLRDIAAALDADVIMEASVEHTAHGVVVAVRLVNAKTDRKMWVETVAGRADDLGDLSRRIAVAANAAVLSRMPARD
jgi:TolB-like protein